ncbi:MAG: HEAT repeat domain-containing protein [Dehalococcoidia bacterium]|nr:MAG: HEAT repeat domain-containing protein [Dehalococcoidia bacterium]
MRELVDEMLKEASTEQELAEISRMIEEAKGKLRLKEDNRGFWEGKTACWEMIACPPEIKRFCPASSYLANPCWELEGTYTKLSDDGMKGDDTQICENCRVYKKWGDGKPIRIQILGRGINISSFIADLSSKDGQVRKNARMFLVAIGGPAVPILIKALADPNKQVRWEAAYSLVTIRDSAAVHALVRALEDEVFDVRWLAAKALIALRDEALVPLLQAVMDHPNSTWLRQGVHHVFQEIGVGAKSELLQPLMFALEHPCALIAPLTVRTAIDTITQSRQHRVVRKVRCDRKKNFVLSRV